MRTQRRRSVRKLCPVPRRSRRKDESRAQLRRRQLSAYGDVCLCVLRSHQLPLYFKITNFATCTFFAPLQTLAPYHDDMDVTVPIVSSAQAAVVFKTRRILAPAVLSAGVWPALGQSWPVHRTDHRTAHQLMSIAPPPPPPPPPPPLGREKSSRRTSFVMDGWVWSRKTFLSLSLSLSVS